MERSPTVKAADHLERSLRQTFGGAGCAFAFGAFFLLVGLLFFVVLLAAG